MTFDIELAARTIWGEARNQSDEGMQAVAWVIINRTHAKKWYSGQTLAETCMMNKQFSCWNVGDPNRVLLLRIAEKSPVLEKCRNFLRGAMAGNIADLTKGSCHYKRTDVKAVWAEGQTPVVTIGDHEFYRGIA